MKDFEASFFKTEKFILSTKKYGSFTNNNVEIHICYNVNDAFIPVMGASLISVIENNKDLNIVFHIFTDGYSKENEQHIKKVAEQFHCICNLYKLDMKPFQGYHIKVERFSRITYARTIMAKLLVVSRFFRKFISSASKYRHQMYGFSSSAGCSISILNRCSMSI